MTVVIAEDNTEVRDLLGMQLDAWGFTVHLAEGGGQAIGTIIDTHPDLVLLDIAMPGVDGLSVLRMMKAEPALAEIPVVMVTGSGDPDVVASVLAQGAYDCVRKPFQLTELRARVEAAASRGRALSVLNSLKAAIEQPQLLRIPGLEIATLSRPADGAVAGGDFMVVVASTGGHLMAIVGDVMGHGVSVAGMAAFMRVTLANTARFTDDPGEVLALANLSMIERTQDQYAPALVTAACLSLHPDSGVWRFALAGHPPALLVSANAPMESDPGPPLGSLPTSYPVTEQHVAGGDRIFLYTDGLLGGSTGEADFTEAQILNALVRTRGLDLDEVLESVYLTRLQHTRGVASDDVSMIVLEPT